MNSVRERILRTVTTRVADAVAPVLVLRAPTLPVSRESSPALLVFAEGDSITAHANSLVERLLTIRLVAIARGNDAFDEADLVAVGAHAALMSDCNLGGLALAVREVDCEWDAEDADIGAVALPSRYEIRYRTHALDLTQTG
jgi:hypothetical protein